MIGDIMRGADPFDDLSVPDTGAEPDPPKRWLDTYLQPESRHSPEESLRFSGIVLAVVAIAYWFTQWPLLDWTRSSPDLDFYVIQPLIWVGVAALALYGWLRLEERPRFSRVLIGIAFLVGLFHVSILIIAGVIGSFGDSPIAGRLLNYPKNLLYISTLLAGAEVARAYLFAVWRRYHRAAAFAAVAIVSCVVALPAAQLTPFESLDRFARIGGGRWIPALALSILATALVEIGGIGPSWSYRLALLGFEWFSPILPDLGWPAVALLGAVVPWASWQLIVNIYRDTAEGEESLPAPAEADEGPDLLLRWVLGGVGGLLVAMYLVLATGLVGLRMFVVDGISMEPAYERGDIAIVRDAPDPASLQVGDVIRFEQGGLSIVHRIVAIDSGPDGLVFTTQGDNAASPDPRVSEEQIEGKVVFLIPEIGHLTLWLRG